MNSTIYGAACRWEVEFGCLVSSRASKLNPVMSLDMPTYRTQSSHINIIFNIFASTTACTGRIRVMTEKKERLSAKVEGIVVVFFSVVFFFFFIFFFFLLHV